MTAHYAWADPGGGTAISETERTVDVLGEPYFAETIDLDERIAIYNERAELMRQYLPITPLISPAFHFYENMGNVWPVEALNSTTIQSPYRPGNYRDNLTLP